MRYPRNMSPTWSHLAFAVLVLLFSSSAAAEKKVPTAEEVLTQANVRLTAPDLIKALSGEDPLIRDAAAKVLGQRRVKEAIPSLRSSLTDPYVYARVSAAGALLRLSDEAGLDLLQSAVASGETPVAVAAANALLSGGSGLGYAPLAERLGGLEQNPKDRVLIARALPAFRTLAGHDALVRNDLIAALRSDPAPEVRRAAASELRSSRDPAVAAAFADVLKTESDSVVRGIAQAHLQRKN